MTNILGCEITEDLKYVLGVAGAVTCVAGTVVSSLAGAACYMFVSQIKHWREIYSASQLALENKTKEFDNKSKDYEKVLLDPLSPAQKIISQMSSSWADQAKKMTDSINELREEIRKKTERISELLSDKNRDDKNIEFQREKIKVLQQKILVYQEAVTEAISREKQAQEAIEDLRRVMADKTDFSAEIARKFTEIDSGSYPKTFASMRAVAQAEAAARGKYEREQRGKLEDKDHEYSAEHMHLRMTF